MREYWWISIPSPYGCGWLTAKVEVVDGILGETHTACPELRGMPWKDAVVELRRRHGDDFLVEKLTRVAA
jgi:hypothetical protein